MRVSYAYCKLITPPGTRCGYKPIIMPHEAPLVTILEKIFTTKLKSRGAKGSPYISPLPVRKKFPSTSFTFTPTEPP
jgi:hypothetical protein